MREFGVAILAVPQLAYEAMFRWVQPSLQLRNSEGEVTLIEVHPQWYIEDEIATRILLRARHSRNYTKLVLGWHVWSTKVLHPVFNFKNEVSCQSVKNATKRPKTDLSLLQLTKFPLALSKMFHRDFKRTHINLCFTTSMCRHGHAKLVARRLVCPRRGVPPMHYRCCILVKAPHRSVLCLIGIMFWLVLWNPPPPPRRALWARNPQRVWQESERVSRGVPQSPRVHPECGKSRCFRLLSDFGAHSFRTLGHPRAGRPGTPFWILFELFRDSGPEEHGGPLSQPGGFARQENKHHFLLCTWAEGRAKPEGKWKPTADVCRGSLFPVFWNVNFWRSFVQTTAEACRKSLNVTQSRRWMFVPTSSLPHALPKMSQTHVRCIMPSCQVLMKGSRNFKVGSGSSLLVIHDNLWRQHETRQKTSKITHCHTIILSHARVSVLPSLSRSLPCRAYLTCLSSCNF